MVQSCTVGLIQVRLSCFGGRDSQVVGKSEAWVLKSDTDLWLCGLSGGRRVWENDGDEVAREQ